jgi:hypothetical protein
MLSFPRAPHAFTLLLESLATQSTPCRLVSLARHTGPPHGRATIVWGHGHDSSQCTSQVRCKSCYCYGHVAKGCINSKRKSSTRWVKKAPSPKPDSSSLHPPPQHASHPPNSAQLPARLPAMANFAINPLPFVPPGFFIREGGKERVRRLVSSPSMTSCFKGKPSPLQLSSLSLNLPSRS